MFVVMVFTLLTLAKFTAAQPRIKTFAILLPALRLSAFTSFADLRKLHSQLKRSLNHRHILGKSFRITS